MSKYYTPEIEEFHVGFEYEWKEKGDHLYDNAIIKDGSQIDDIHLYRKDGQTPVYDLRVKHLDQEDIESFGWKSIKEDKEVTMYKFFMDEFRGRRRTTLRMAYNSRSNWIALAMVDEKYNMMGEQDEHPVFSGEIKNKSEFKRILNQIGVL